MKKENIIGAIAILAFLAGVVGLFTAGPQGPQGPQGPTANENIVGAMPGNEINGNYFTVGGATYYSIREPMISGTTTPNCFKNPPVRSKLLSWTSNFSTGTTSVAWLLATSSANNATTTVITKRTFAGEASFTWSPVPATSTSEVSTLNGIMRPNEFVCLGAEQTAVASGGFKVTGDSSALYQLLDN